MEKVNAEQVIESLVESWEEEIVEDDIEDSKFLRDLMEEFEKKVVEDMFEGDQRKKIVEEEDEKVEDDENATWWKKMELIMRGIGFNFVESEADEDDRITEGHRKNNAEEFLHNLGFKMVEDDEVLERKDEQQRSDSYDNVTDEIEEEDGKHWQEKVETFLQELGFLVIDMDTIEVAKLIMRKIKESDWKFNVNVEELTKYMAMNMNRTGCSQLPWG